MVPTVNGDPIGSHASLSPVDIAVLPSGDLAVLEDFFGCIRRISPNGAVTTIAGIRGVSGMVDGEADKALFRLPTSLAVDATGVIYVADSFNNAIRRVTPDGVVSLVAGGQGGGPNNSGSADGVGSAARFNFPRGVVITNGLIYVADTGNCTIRTITPQGSVTTLSGSVGVHQSIDGPIGTARFAGPTRIAADGGGNIYVLDSFAVRKITPGGNVSTLAGKAGESGFSDGVGGDARFSSFGGITASKDGTLFVMDNERVRMITTAGKVTTVAGGYPAQFIGDQVAFDGKGSEARFKGSKGITIDSSGTLVVVDEKVRRVTSDMTVTTLPAATLFPLDNTADDTGAMLPVGGVKDIAVDAAGNIYFADFGDACFRRLTPSGVLSTMQPMDLRPDGRKVPVPIHPATLAVDSAGIVYFFEGGALGRIGHDGVVTLFAGDRIYNGTADGIGRQARFNSPQRIAFDNQNNLYVADTYSYTIRKVTPEAVVSTLAGSPGNAGNVDGTGNAAQFAWPLGIAVDSVGNVYVADTRYIAVSETIRKITPSGVVTTLAGVVGQSGNVDGVGGSARFSHPTALATDRRGNVYVADAWNRRLRKITPAGVVTTLAGSDVTPPGIDGTGAAATFDTVMSGITVDSVGNLYALDGSRIRVASSTLKARSLNVSTRVQVLQDENVLIAGFIIGGTSTKKVIIRAQGPSLAANSLTGVLSDPAMELYDGSGALIASNDNWRINAQTQQSQEAAIVATGFQPSDDREAAIVATLDPEKAYTAVVHGAHGEKGISVVEVYDLTSTTAAALANISSRGFVEAGDKAMIAGFILGGNNGNGEVVVRALGPSLSQWGIKNPLVNPTLQLFNANGQIIAFNDNWNDTNGGAIQSVGLQPPDALEAAILTALPAGAYTAVVGGYGGSGVGLVEVFNLP